MKFILFIGLVLLFVSAGVSDAEIKNGRERQRSGKLIVERPSKQAKGLLEKPLFGHENVDSDEEPVESNEPEEASWISRIWKNAFRTNRDPFSETDFSVESSEQDESEGFFASLKPWWKGPNMCTSENQYFVPNEETNSFSSFFTFLMAMCSDSGRSYKCSKKSRFNSTTVKVQTVTYECCSGYARDPSSRLGCPKKVDQLGIMDTLEKVNATKLANALQDANLTSLENGMVTLFAPSDNAMTSDNLNDISVVVLETRDKMQFARDILRSHIVAGPRKFSSDDFEDETLLPTTLNGSSIRINIFHRPTPFATANCAKIVSSDHQTTDGFVHVIDRVLTPVRRNLWQLIEDDPRFSIMRSLIDEPLKRRLIDPKQHLTLMAFTDDTFEKLSSDMRQRIRSKDNCFNNLMLHHILPHTICTAAIFDDRGYVQNLANRLLNATRLDENTVTVGNRKVITKDQIATNGVIHVVDGVILVPEMLDIIGALEESGDSAKAFAQALKLNGYPSILNNTQSVTVFVPPASSIPSMNLDALRHHIVRQSVLDRFRVVLNRPKTLTTDAGKNITIRFEFDFAQLFDWNGENRLRLNVGCARAEKIASSCNGAIVFLDKPLSTPEKTVYDLLKSKSEFSDFVSMIDRARLVDTFKGNRFDGTVLAPTNEALGRALRNGEKQRLMNNQSRLRRFIKNHVILGTKCCNQLTEEDWLTQARFTTMSGTSLTSVGIDSRNLNIGGASLKTCDLIATNGMIHGVDNVVNNRRQWRWGRFDDSSEE